METVDTSAKIKCLIEMALKGEITWLNLDSILNRLSPTLEKSKLIIRALLSEFRSHQSICFMKQSEDAIEVDENQYNSDSSNFIKDNKDLPKNDCFIASQSDNQVFENRLQSKDLNNIELVEEFKDQFYTFIAMMLRHLVKAMKLMMIIN